MPTPLKIKYKLLLLLSAILLFTILISSIAASWIVKKSQRDSLLNSFTRTEQVVEALLSAQRSKLVNQAMLVGILPILSTVVENGDADTILDTAQGYQKQLDLPIFDIFDDAGDLLVSLDNSFTIGEKTGSAFLISQALEGNSQASLALRGGKPVQLAAAPIGTPDEPYGVLVVGTYLNSQFASEIKKLTQTDISFLIKDQITESTLQKEEQDILWAKVQKELTDRQSAENALDMDIGSHLLRLKPLEDSQGKTIGQVIVQFSLAESAKVLRNIRYLLLGIGVIVFLISIILGGYFSTQSITKPIQLTVETLKDVAKGDLTKQIEIHTRDEIGELAGEFNVFLEKLRHTIGQVAQLATRVSFATTELSSTAEQIAAGSEQASVQADTVASATEELSATAQEIAENCVSAVQAADAATSATDNGREVVQKTIDGMNQIAQQVQESAQTIEALNQSAEKIGQIVGTIDDIADQTNLLALNAAIEAARAGEQGRGFAVVADEVRKLAESTANSTKEIVGMVQTIQKETQAAVELMEQGVADVSTGNQLATQTGDALETIAQHIVQVTDRIRLVAIAAEEQTATTGEITQNIQQIASVTQQSASGAQQSAQATVQLSGLSNQLEHLVGQFKLSENGEADSQGGVEAQTKLVAVPTDLTLETEAVYAQTSKLNN